VDLALNGNGNNGITRNGHGNAPSAAHLSLDSLIEHPTQLAALSPTILAALAGRCAAVQAAIAAALVTAAVNSSCDTPIGRDDREGAPPRLLTAREVARLTGFALSYVYELIRSGSLRAVKIGKYRRVTEQSLAEWIAQHETAVISKGVI